MTRANCGSDDRPGSYSPEEVKSLRQPIAHASGKIETHFGVVHGDGDQTARTKLNDPPNRHRVAWFDSAYKSFGKPCSLQTKIEHQGGRVRFLSFSTPRSF